MLTNNQIWTVLLLIGIAILIYYLTSPVISEKFAEVALDKQPEIKTEMRSEMKPMVDETSLFNFEGNSESEEYGAAIDNAFEKFTAQDQKPDEVPMNKNNQEKYDAKDYLPKEVNDKWFDTDFSQAKFNVNDDKLINVDKYIIGVNTVGSSMKNASYDIRGTVVNPKYVVSPWMNSSIDPDLSLKPLC